MSDTMYVKCCILSGVWGHLQSNFHCYLHKNEYTLGIDHESYCKTIGFEWTCLLKPKRRKSSKYTFSMIIEWLPSLIIKHNTSISSILTWYTRWHLSNYITYIKLEINYKTRKIWPNQLMDISVWMSLRYVNTMDVWLYNFPPKVFWFMFILIYDINVNKKNSVKVIPENRRVY